MLNSGSVLSWPRDRSAAFIVLISAVVSMSIVTAVSSVAVFILCPPKG